MGESASGARPAAVPRASLVRIIDRYLLRSFVVPFLLGLGVFSVIVLGDVARGFGSVAFSSHIPARLLLKYLALRAPGVLVLSLPVGTLLGVCMTINRLTGHNETTAMRAGNISLWRISYPLLAAALAISAVDFLINEAVVPRSNATALRTWGEITLSQPLVRAESNIAVRDERGHFYFLGHLDPATNTITSVYIDEPAAAHGSGDDPVPAADWVVPRRIIVAQRAQYSGAQWTLYEGADYRLDAQGRLQSWAPFERMPYHLREALQRYIADERSPYEMDARELRRRIGVLETAGRDASVERVGLQFKYAVPLACLVFALIGIPLSQRFARSGSFAGILVAIILVFLYNGVMSWTKALSLGGALHPLIAAHLQNVLFGGLGIYLLHRAQ